MLFETYPSKEKLCNSKKIIRSGRNKMKKLKRESQKSQNFKEINENTSDYASLIFIYSSPAKVYALYFTEKQFKFYWRGMFQIYQLLLWMNRVFSIYFIGINESSALECELYLHNYFLPNLTIWTPCPFMQDGILRHLSLLCRMKFKGLKNCGPITITNTRLSFLSEQRSCPIRGYL